MKKFIMGRSGELDLKENMIPDEILLKVEKPARYIGNEINMVKKNPEKVLIRYAFCFPDVYEVGMSHLGTEILYYFLNEREDTYCERVFAPWIDMEEIMREKNYPLFALETLDPVTNFDFLGFTLQYEMSFTNIVNMLELANIPIFSEDRKDDFPIIMAGGPCAYNPEPLADIVDFFYIGEGEKYLNEILDIYKENKALGLTKNDFLEKILEIPCVYVPKFYHVTYKENGEIEDFYPINPKAPKEIRKEIVDNVDEEFFPEKQLVPLIEVVHDRVTLEVFRGCIRGCRFCQAGYVYRPVREKKAETLLEQSKSLVKNSGHEEISLVSLSTGDYSEFKNLAESLLDEYKDKNVNISLPSLRIDAFSLDLMEKVQAVRKSGLTFAPEAGTQRLRDVINKGITEEEILEGSRLAFSGGWSRVKLYFMIGLPTETEEDILGIARLAEKIVEVFYSLPKAQRKGDVNVVLSTSCFVPKPFTPFEWYGQDSLESFTNKQKLLKSSIKNKHIRYNYHDAELSFLEAVIARGDRKLSKVIVRAQKLGCKFDGWSELFNYELWLKAFEEEGIDPHFYANRQREYSEKLPWDHITIGVNKEFFIDEMEKSKNEAITLNCREKCSNCGAAIFGQGVCYGK